VLGRKLTCYYDTDSSSSYALWPTFNLCKIDSVDLSEHYKNAEHSFSGTPEEKSAVSVVFFNTPAQIEFLPKQMLKDFPQLNGLQIQHCKTLTTIRDTLFTEDFGAIQYLDLWHNKIATIEPNAFHHLPKLKWIQLAANQLNSLPHQIFKNNPELISIELHGNQIYSITPDFFKNLNKLQRVDPNPNACTNKEFGCYSGSCLVSQVELNSGLSTCYSNCLADSECTPNSE
jgi:hypothetical protein